MEIKIQSQFLYRQFLLIFSVFIFIFFGSKYGFSESTKEIIEEGNNVVVELGKCIQITSRIDRLACFDALFPPLQSKPVNPSLHFWKNKFTSLQLTRAKENEQKRDSETGFIFTQSDTVVEGKADIWATSIALGTTPPRPILMLSCISDISRVELFLPHPITQQKMTVTIKGKRNVTQQWVTDASGTIIRSGRGLVAIEGMLAMLHNRKFELLSDNQAVNGLTFDTDQLKEKIKPMRKTCGW